MPDTNLLLWDSTQWLIISRTQNKRGQTIYENLLWDLGTS